MTTIHLPVYGQVSLESPIRILETPELQRLKGVLQLSGAEHVYPGADYSRFEHSLGVNHMAGLMADELGFSEYQILNLKVAGLLHDVAHLPCSHTLEPLYLEKTGNNHMEVVDGCFSGEYFSDRESETIIEVLEENGILGKEIEQLINGEHENKSMRQIIHGNAIDADQIDYLLRDSCHTNNVAGNIDYTRLLKVLRVKDEEIMVAEKGANDIESMLFARLQMYRTVYLHPVSTCVSSMIAKATEPVIDEFPLEKMLSLTDSEFFIELKDKGDFQEDIYKRLKRRNLYKRAFQVKTYSDKDSIERVADLSKRGYRTLEKEIADEADISVNEVIVNFPVDDIKITEPRINKKKDINVLGEDGSVRKLSEMKPVAREILKEPGTDYLLLVFTPKEYRCKVEKAAEKLYF